MAYGEYANSGKSFGKCLYQLSKIGVPLRVIEDVVLHGGGLIFYCGEHFATIVSWDDSDTPTFKFVEEYKCYTELQVRYAQMPRL